VIPTPALPLFQAGLANLPGKTDATVDVRRQRGPLLMIAGGADRTVPAATVRSAYKRYRPQSLRDGAESPRRRSHSQPIDHGWLDVARYAMDFLASNGPRTRHDAQHAQSRRDVELAMTSVNDTAAVPGPHHRTDPPPPPAMTWKPGCTCPRGMGRIQQW